MLNKCFLVDGFGKLWAPHRRRRQREKASTERKHRSAERMRRVRSSLVRYGWVEARGREDTAQIAWTVWTMMLGRVQGVHLE